MLKNANAKMQAGRAIRYIFCSAKASQKDAASIPYAQKPVPKITSVIMVSKTVIGIIMHWWIVLKFVIEIKRTLKQQTDKIRIQFTKVKKHILNLMSLLFIISSNTACSQTLSNKEKTMEKDNNELQILNIVRQFTQLMIERNTKGIDKLVAEDFTLTHITDYVQSKAEWYAEIESESMKYYGYTEVKTSVKIDGNKATFIGQNLLDARIWGSRNNWRLQQKMELEKKNNKWIIQKSVATTF